MKSRLFVTLVAGAIAACGGVDDEDPGSLGQAVINGGECAPDAYPTAVALLVDLSVETNRGVGRMKTLLCNGTLIAPDVVLTAAHCVDLEGMIGGQGKIVSSAMYISFEPDLVALADSEYANELGEFPADARPASHWIKHPEFSLRVAAAGGPGNAKDIGLLFLAEPVAVQPELLPTAEEATQIVEGLGVAIAGWGLTTVSPRRGASGRKMCGDTTINELGEFEMQIGGDRSTTRKCQGDSGGPTYAELVTTHAVSRRVIGITSHSYDQTNCAKGGLDTRVDAWLGWIDATLTAECDAGTRAWCEVKGILPPEYFDPKPKPPEPPVDDGAGGDTAPSCAGCGVADLPGFAGLFAIAALGRRRRA